MDGSKLLFEASREGSVPSLQQLLQEDPLILDRYTILNTLNDTPLHVASMLGHLDFVKEILTRKPELAAKLNSLKSSPLHLASAKGYVEIVKELIRVAPEMCVARDKDGWNPLHHAAVNGRVDVLKVLLQEGVDPAAAMVGTGETILQLCLKHNQLEALKLLVDTLKNHNIIDCETIEFIRRNTSMRNADLTSPEEPRVPLKWYEKLGQILQLVKNEIEKLPDIPLPDTNHNALQNVKHGRPSRNGAIMRLLQQPINQNAVQNVRSESNLDAMTRQLARQPHFVHGRDPAAVALTLRTLSSAIDRVGGKII